MILALASVSLRRRANRMGEGPEPSSPFLPFYFFTFKLVLIKSIPATGILRITALVVAASVSAATALGVVATTRLASATRATTCGL